jgi:hypothetical protein
MDWGIPYTIGKIFELRCLKWAHMTHLDISNISYGQKNGQESNRQFDSKPLKVRNHSYFFACRWHVTYHWKAFDKGYKFSLDLISIEGFHAKLWTPKVVKVLVVRILGLPLGNNETKCHLDAHLVARHRVYYKGKVVASPKSRSWWVLWVRVCPWWFLNQKCFNYVLINLLFSLCRSMRVIKCLSFFLVPSQSSNMPLYPKVLWAKERASTPCSSIIFTSESHLSLSRSLGTHQKVTNMEGPKYFHHHI